jgi:hypothetical protein
MPTIEVNGKHLLDVVKKMAPEEFNAFLAEALSLRSRTKATTLSAEETKLIKRINRGLPVKLSKRYAHLMSRRKKGILTADEHQELLKLTNQAESRDADQAAALLELAKLRSVPVRTLMKQMGIKAPAIHG